MAGTDRALVGFGKRQPNWPDDAPAHRVAVVGYNPYADELVVRFENAAGRFAIVEPIATPDDHYANVMADEATGDVIGVQIDRLRDVAVPHFPHWAAAATEGDPPPEAIDRLVRDVRNLFDRYGVGGLVWSNGALVPDR
jgi:hypothetical protein